MIGFLVLTRGHDRPRADAGTRPTVPQWKGEIPMLTLNALRTPDHQRPTRLGTEKTEDTTRLKPKTRGPWGKLLAPLVLTVLAGALLLALWSPPAGAATTFTVNKTGDDPDRNLSNARCDTSTNSGDQCTLRAAMEEANDTSGADTIEFDIDGSSVKTISPDSGLPTITDAVTIDGYTQQGASENTLEEGTDAVLKIQLDGSQAGTDVSGLVIDDSDSTVKGLVISRFDDHGILLDSGTGSRVEDNFVGTNPAGTADRGNLIHGVFCIVAGTGNTVGGTSPEARNLVSGNNADGVVLSGCDESEVLGNPIGTTADGTGDLGNDDDGVGVVNSSNDTNTGGTDPSAANTIAFNGDRGVVVDFPASTGNSVLSNSIFDNGGLGIDLNDNGVSNNDEDDPDTGANNLQNFPDITSASKSFATGFTTIRGSLNSNPNQDFLIQCFLADVVAFGGSAHGEGKLLLDTTSRTTDSSGDTTFQCDTREAGAGREVTATATNVSTGDTSEFAENALVTGVISPP